ncbi:glycosyltransferase [Vagococcus zengguangii]|uniref:glycosyltransferase n=1 Tax=Vagococcus zengguangii TaxID=2571750 RepID=UPI0011090CFE|nr:glycosyltransferase family 2 protein [Vagococcus zengguangii]TLG80947.1 glycosyltransferase family 2 protein [Vagococcus zengguangii]
MDKLGVVILNYLNFNDTIECVDSLLSQTKQPDVIVIVDNYSNNESVKNIKKKYIGIDYITIIEVKKNVGYARGNNVGIDYCIKSGINDVLVINNDTLFNDSTVIEKIYALKIGEDIGAIGPCIIGSDNLMQNPVYKDNSMYSMLRRYIYTLVSESVIYSKMKNNKVVETNSISKKSKTFSYYLHGSAILLTKNYLDRIPGFYPKTFLYVEENILDFIMKKLHLKMLYVDNIVINHKEDQSSALAFNNDSKIYLKHMKKSSKIAIFVKLKTIRKIQRIVKKYNMKEDYNVIIE